MTDNEHTLSGQSGHPRVLNKRTDHIPPDAIYVGRPTRYGNPFVIGPDGNREEVIEQYAATVRDRLSPGDLEDLRGHDLVCWCAPLPCHADVLLELANRAEAQRVTSACVEPRPTADADSESLRRSPPWGRNETSRKEH